MLLGPVCESSTETKRALQRYIFRHWRYLSCSQWHQICHCKELLISIFAICFNIQQVISEEWFNIHFEFKKRHFRYCLFLTCIIRSQLDYIWMALISFTTIEISATFAFRWYGTVMDYRNICRFGKWCEKGSEWCLHQWEGFVISAYNTPI